MKPPIPDLHTPMSHDDLIVALLGGYRVVFGRAPLPMELAIYYGQCLLENGATLGAVHCYCLGNIKATPAWTGDTCQYACDETVTTAEAAALKKMDPGHCEVHPIDSKRARVVLTPPHPWTTFRAFHSAADGAAAYLRLFSTTRYAQAALRARAGDAVGFVRMAKAGGYFTAPDVTAYERAVLSIASHAAEECRVAIEDSAAPKVDEDYVNEQIQGLVALTTWNSAEEALHPGEERDTIPSPPPEEVA